MTWRSEWRAVVLIVAIFLSCFWLPVGNLRFDTAILEALHLVRWYAREHVILCLLPAFLIAGAISTFVSQAAVMRYLGPSANKFIAYGVASVSGTTLAVCSCTVLPLFAGIYRRGAGLGPATAFLYAGPAINVLAIILTARVLGIELGIARGVGAILFAVVIGLIMHVIFRREGTSAVPVPPGTDDAPARGLGREALFFAVLVGILIFANWAPSGNESGAWDSVYAARWILTSALGLCLGGILIAWFGARWWKVLAAAGVVLVSALLVPGTPTISFVVAMVALAVILNSTEGETEEWLSSSWGFAKQILPLLLIGVVIAGALLGRPGSEGLIPSEWVGAAVGGNSFRANIFASVAGAFMYFATLTEVPILQGLIGNGMGPGPALALLLAGPALSLPNMLVIRSVIGTRKTAVYVLLVIVMSTISGVIYGWLAGRSG